MKLKPTQINALASKISEQVEKLREEANQHLISEAGNSPE